MASTLILVSVFFYSLLIRTAAAASLQADLIYGVYQGYTNSTTGLNIWKGIRFAAPPVGNLRWQPPRFPSINRTVVQANNFGSACPQSYPSVPNAPFIPGNEDCLFLNIWAPPNANNLPVLVWIHGGGYGIGDGTQDMSSIVTANGNKFIVVSIQYRLGAFGFLSSQDVKNRGVANAGLLDQAFALAWVQLYIRKFGGDADKVTIMGESAGAGSVMLHSIALGGLLGTTIFENAIAASPYLPSQYPYNAAYPTARYNEFVTKAGCASAASKFDCLVSKDSMTLQLASSNVSSSQVYGTWAFVPVTDGEYILSTPSGPLANKKINGKRAFIGNNANEGPLFVPPTINTQNDLTTFLQQLFPTLTSADIATILNAYPSSSGPVNPNDPKFATNGINAPTAVNVSQVATGQQQRLNNIVAESTFVCPSYWLASAYTGNSRTAYKYQYSIPFGSHGDDVSGYFGPPTENQGPDFIKAFQTMFGNFITAGNPSISAALANGASANSTTAANPATNWPAWTDGASPKQLNLNETGGVPYQAVTFFGATVTQFKQPGLQNKFTQADASAWEGGRGQRCDFWKTLAPKIFI